MKNKIKIPKEFKCFGETIKIEFNNDICNENNMYGESQHPRSRIILTDKYHGMKITSEHLNISLYHELIHVWLDRLNYQTMIEKNTNLERFVHTLASLIHQYEVTKK